MTRLLALLPLAAAWGCAAPAPLTVWGYSDWFRQGGTGSMGDFNRVRAACLEEAGAAQEPASVVPDSDQENSFVLCMNRQGWCSNAYACEKSGAS